MVRVSGPRAFDTLDRLAGQRPELRRATLVDLIGDEGVLDRALVLRFDGPNTATGEDLVEYHLHGGRAVVAAVEKELRALEGVRAAEPGEFTRRAFANGRMDLTEVEGLADLLAAETEAQRRAAMLAAGGALSRKVQDWTARLLRLAAGVEAVLDFSDEGDVDEALPDAWEAERQQLAAEITALLARPPAERLRDGVRVVIAGPPNSGKSTLLNALVGREAAITSPIAGTTRDLVEAPIALAGLPIILIDSAGLRDSDDEIEAIGVERAHRAMRAADLILWLGRPSDKPAGQCAIAVASKSDLGGGGEGAELAISALTGAGIDALVERMVLECRALLPAEGEASVNARQRLALGEGREHLASAGVHHDLLLVAEELRQARLAFDRVTGRAGVDDMLDALFGQFCIGK